MEINKAKIDNIYNMLQSTEEDRKIGLTVLEKLDYKKNLVPILLIIRKCSKINKYVLKNEAAKLLDNIDKTINNVEMISYDDIYKIINSNEYDVPSEHSELFVNDVTNFVGKTIKECDMQFINGVSVDININVNEQNRVIS